MKNFLFALLTLLLLQNCSTLDHLAIQWKYRNDYKLPSENIKTDNPFKEFQASAKLNNITVPSTKPLPEINHLEKISLEKKKTIIASTPKKKKHSIRKIFKQIQLASIASDTPQPSKYYNNYYNSGTEKRVPKEARRGFMFGFLSLIPYGGLVLCFFAMINGGIGLYKIEKNPELYRGRGYALAGLGMGLFVLCLYAVLIFYILMSSSNFFLYR